MVKLGSLKIAILIMTFLGLTLRPAFSAGIERCENVNFKNILKTRLKSADVTEQKAGENTLGETTIPLAGDQKARLTYKYIPAQTKLYISIPKKGRALNNVAFEKTSDFTEHCLNLEINFAKKLSILNIINTELDCGLPKGIGKNIMGLVDQISSNLPVNSIELLDASEIKCRQQNATNTTPFALYYLMKNGVTWYESFGYTPLFLAQNTYEGLKKDIRDIPLQKIIDEFTALATIYYDEPSLLGGKIMPYLLKNFKPEGKSPWDELKKYRTMFNNQNKNKETLANFLVWLWDNHCKDFNKIYDLIFPESDDNKFLADSLIDANWSDKKLRLVGAIGAMSKKLGPRCK